MNLEQIKQKALELGFDDAGITEALVPAEDQASYYQWIAANQHGDLAYMAKSIRLDPNCVLEGAKTAILFVSNYKKAPLPFFQGKGLIAAYARGRDYHNIHARRLKAFIAWFEEQTGERARGFSDSKPVMERALAAQAGLGWFGKSTLLIHRRFGTFTLLSGVFTTWKPTSLPVLSTRFPRCGTCTRCIDACPTKAIGDYTMDARLCLSYHLIEQEGAVSAQIASKNPGYGFGCDICQTVCPHNVRSPLSTSPDFSEERQYIDAPFVEAALSDPSVLFGSPLKRKGADGLKANLQSLS